MALSSGTTESCSVDSDREVALLEEGGEMSAEGTRTVEARDGLRTERLAKAG